MAFTPPPQPTVPTTDGKVFPVRRIFCIGQNYADHVKEMGGKEDAAPIFFSKPADAVVAPTEGAPNVAYPPKTDNLHFEGELVLALNRGGRDIAEADALNHLYGLALGCDLTRRVFAKGGQGGGRAVGYGQGVR